MENTKHELNIRTRKIKERRGNGLIETITPTWGQWIEYTYWQEQGASLQAQEVQRQKPLKKPTPYPESETEFQGRCTDL